MFLNEASRGRDIFFRILGLILAAAGTSAAAQEEVLRPLHLGLILPSRTASDALRDIYITGIEQGAIMAAEEFAFNASLFQIDFSVEIVRAGPEDVPAAADRLVRADGVMALIGGTNETEAVVLGSWAAERGVPFLNIAATSDRLRNERCETTTFHLAPSAAMYLDALASWYVRAGFRRWYFIRSADEEGEAQYRRAVFALKDRHFGAREAGEAVLGEDRTPAKIAADVGRSDADLVVLLTPHDAQLDLLAALESAGVKAEVTGFPSPETQTRAFAAASREAAPLLGAGHRAVAWEPTLDAYGARELNARYQQRWGEPMEAGGWAAYQAVKFLFEAATLGGATDSAGVLAYFDNESTVFDAWKGIGTSFRPWDRQLRQPIYLTKINSMPTEDLDAALLVGELPAISMPGTDPIERLDQLGDLGERSQCSD